MGQTTSDDFAVLTVCACRKALEDLERVMYAFPAFENTRKAMKLVLDTPCPCTEMRVFDLQNQLAETQRELTAAKAEREAAVDAGKCECGCNYPDKWGQKL